MTIFVNIGSVYLQGCLVSLIPSYPLKFSLRLEHTAPPPACCTQSSSLGDTQSEWGNDGGREPLRRRSGLGGEGMRARETGTFQPGLPGRAISSAPARRRRGARQTRAEPEPLPHPSREPRCGGASRGGGRRPPLPASATRCQGCPALLLGPGRGRSTTRFSPAGNVQHHPHASVYKAPVSAGGRSRIPYAVRLQPGSRIRPSPAS